MWLTQHQPVGGTSKANKDSSTADMEDLEAANDDLQVSNNKFKKLFFRSRKKVSPVPAFFKIYKIGCTFTTPNVHNDEIKGSVA